MHKKWFEWIQEHMPRDLYEEYGKDAVAANIEWLALNKSIDKYADLLRRVKELYQPFVDDKYCSATMIRRDDFIHILPEVKG